MVAEHAANTNKVYVNLEKKRVLLESMFDWLNWLNSYWKPEIKSRNEDPENLLCSCV